jgi:hypothetical protein
VEITVMETALPRENEQWHGTSEAVRGIICTKELEVGFRGKTSFNPEFAVAIDYGL